MKFLIFNIVQVLLCLSLCMQLNVAAAQSSDKKSDERKILSVLKRQQEAWNRGDIAGYMAGYWNSDSLLFTSGGNVRRGWNITYEKYKASYSTREKMGVLKFSGLEVTRLGPDAATVFGHWELTRSGDHPEGVFTLILKKFADGWKIIHDHTSSLQSPEKK